MSVPKPEPEHVRMRGFRHRTTVGESLDWIDAHTTTLASEPVALQECIGRVLAEDATAAVDVPPFDRSAMDGYAIRADETLGADDYNPIGLRVIGQSLPGRPFQGEVKTGTAVRITTGAPIPAGADAVIPVEDAREAEGVVSLTSSVPTAKHIGRCGEDVKAGSRLLAAGRRLRPQDAGVLASVGTATLNVVRRPRVRVLITGEELARPGEERNEFQIFEANSFILRGLVARDGGVLESVRPVVDDRDAIRRDLTEAGADVVLISGGSSVGPEDLAPQLVAEEGELAIHGVAMRPSSPAGLGRIGEAFVFLLPGNPVSCLCAYDFFAGRAIRRLGGLPADWPYATRTGTLKRKIVSQIGRTDYCRVRLADEVVEPLAVSGASILSSTVRANGFVVVPAEREGHAAGEAVTVHLYDAWSDPA